MGATIAKKLVKEVRKLYRMMRLPRTSSFDVHCGSVSTLASDMLANVK